MKAGDLALGADALIVAALSSLFAFAAIGLMMRWLARADFLFVGYQLILGVVLLVAIQLAIYKPHYTGIYRANRPPGRKRARYCGKIVSTGVGVIPISDGPGATGRPHCRSPAGGPDQQ